MALKARSIKIDDDVWAAWQAEARAAGVSLTALITARMTAKAARPEKVIRPTKPVAVVSQVPAPKPPIDADREYRRKLLTGAFNPTKARKAKP